jgi:hypothetical protein
MTPTGKPARSTGLLTNTLGALAVVAGTLVTWWLWLGRDSTYYVDPATGYAAGPYTGPQVAGCVLSLVAIGAVGAWFMWPWLTALALTSTFTVAWTVHAAQNDDSGLFAVGAVFLLFGLTLGSTVVCGGVWLLRWILGRRQRPAQPFAAR